MDFIYQKVFKVKGDFETLAAADITLFFAALNGVYMLIIVHVGLSMRTTGKNY